MKLNYSKYIDPYIDKILNNKIEHNIEQEEMCLNLIIPVLDREDVFIDHKAIEDGLSLQKYFEYDLIEWEKFLFALIAGVKFKDGQIFYNEIDIIVGRGAGKNGFISFLCFYFLSPYHGIRHYDIDIIANGEQQAKTSLNDLYELITDNHNAENNKALKKFYSATKEEITGLFTKSSLRINTSSTKGKDSKRSGCIIVDEKHEYTLKDVNNLNTLKSGLGKKENSRYIMITTDGHVRGGALDRDKITFKTVLSKYNPRNRKLIFWCRLENEKDWNKPEKWIMANPSLNNFKTLKDKMIEEMLDMPTTPEYYPEFMAKRMNCPVGNKEIEVAKWEDLTACDQKIVLEELKNKPCIGSLDFAKTDDFITCGLLFKHLGKYIFYHHTFVCKNSSDLLGITAPLDEWEKMGMLEFVEDVEIPPDLIANWFKDKIDQGFNILKIAIDNFRFSILNTALKKIGFDAYEAKNIKLVRPSDLMIAAPIINTIFLRHNLIWGDSTIPGIHNIMCWFSNNVKKVLYNGNVRFEKIEEHYRKTDGFVAYANSITCIEDLNDEITTITEEVKNFMTTLTFN